MAIQIPRPQGTDPAAILAWGNALAGTLERLLAAGHQFGNLATPAGPAQGDLGGQYPAPRVTATHLANPLPVAQGGTGSATLAAHGILLGEGTAAVAATAAMTNGQILVGQTGADPLPETMSGDATLSAGGALTIAANAVTNAKLAQAPANTIKGNNTGSIANETDLTVAQANTMLLGAANPGQPNFSVYLNGNQSIANNVDTKVLFNTKVFDSGGYFDAATNFRYTPQVPGTYLICVSVNQTGTMSAAITKIFKNGSEFARGTQVNGTIGVLGGPAVALIQMNGTTDFVEGVTLQLSSGGAISGNQSSTYMWGCRIGP